MFRLFNLASQAGSRHYGEEGYEYSLTNDKEEQTLLGEGRDACWWRNVGGCRRRGRATFSIRSDAPWTIFCLAPVPLPLFHLPAIFLADPALSALNSTSPVNSLDERTDVRTDGRTGGQAGSWLVRWLPGVSLILLIRDSFRSQRLELFTYKCVSTVSLRQMKRG